MKKNFKKLFILLLSVIASLMPAIGVLADAIPEKFNAKSYRYDTPIEFLGNFHVIKTTGGKHVFCMQYNKTTPNSKIEYTKGNVITDSGMNYILNKAYGIKTDNEHYIYKSALWLYMIDKGLMDGNYDVVKSYKKAVKNSNTQEAKKILELVTEAKKASANDTKAPTIKVDTSSNTFTLDSAGKYYVSNEVKVTSSTGKYTVSLTDAPNGSTIEEGTNSFVIKVPVSAVKELETTISFKVNNTKDIYTSYKYTPSNSSYQPLAVTYRVTKTDSAIGKLNLSTTVSVPFLKVDAETGKAISGAKLKLTNSKGKEIETWTSTTEEKVIKELPEDTYTLTEIEAPSGYKKVDASVKFSIDSKGNIFDSNGKKIVKVVISNKKITYSVPFLKVDAETGQAIKGAELKLTNSNGKEIETWTSTTEEKVIRGLLPGKYTLTETKAPNGYNTLKTTIEFTIDNNGKILDSNNKEIKIIKIENEKKTGGVIISKRDITTGEELPEAKLQIKDANGNTKEEWTWVSSDKPHYIEKLEPGDYTLTEILQPEGYILSEETITFTITEDGKVEEVVMYNKPIPEEEIPVEPTSSFKTMTSTVIGSLIILAGSYIIIKNSKKKEN